MRISDWSSDVCSSDLLPLGHSPRRLPRGTRALPCLPPNPSHSVPQRRVRQAQRLSLRGDVRISRRTARLPGLKPALRERSEEHTSELQSLMRISYAVFCSQKNNNIHLQTTPTQDDTIIVL